MLGRLTYAALDLGFGLPPLLVLAVGGREELARKKSALGLLLTVSLAYSALAERGAHQRGLWQASKHRTTGASLLGSPWEEWLSLVEMTLGLGAVTLLLEARSRRPRAG